MKLGFVSAILPDLKFEDLVDFAAGTGYKCIEICCWPLGKTERRYAGVTHIDVDAIDDFCINAINLCLKNKGIEISGLGYYPNPLDPDEEKSKFYVSHIMKVIDASVLLGVNKINTFIGRDKNKTIDENFERFLKIWKPLIQYAESKNVKVGIENCPMIFSRDEWPGGNNLATTPPIWRRMFSEIKSDFFGLNYDPSHMLWQHMDYIKPISEFRDKIFHVHLKDTRLDKDRLNDVGIMAYPTQFYTPKLPGLGDVDWSKFFSALYDIKYDGPVCVEVEDRAFESSIDDRKKSLVLSKRYLDQFVI